MHFFCEGDQFLCLLHGLRERLFAEQVFAGQNDPAVQLRMSLRRSQIDHNLRFAAVQQFIGRADLRDTEQCGKAASGFGQHVSAGGQTKLGIESLDVGRVGFADHPASEDADAE